MPINLLQVPTSVRDLDEAWGALCGRRVSVHVRKDLRGCISSLEAASSMEPQVHRALQLCEILCAKLAFVGKDVEGRTAFLASG